MTTTKKRVRSRIQFQLTLADARRLRALFQMNVTIPEAVGHNDVQITAIKRFMDGLRDRLTEQGVNSQGRFEFAKCVMAGPYIKTPTEPYIKTPTPERLSIQVGDRVKFIQSSEGRSKIPGRRLALTFHPGYQANCGRNIVQKVEGKFFTLAAYPTLWAPLSAVVRQAK